MRAGGRRGIGEGVWVVAKRGKSLGAQRKEAAVGPRGEIGSVAHLRVLSEGKRRKTMRRCERNLAVGEF